MRCLEEGFECSCVCGVCVRWFGEADGRLPLHPYQDKIPFSISISVYHHPIISCPLSLSSLIIFILLVLSLCLPSPFFPLLLLLFLPLLPSFSLSPFPHHSPSLPPSLPPSPLAAATSTCTATLKRPQRKASSTSPPRRRQTKQQQQQQQQQQQH